MQCLPHLIEISFPVLLGSRPVNGDRLNFYAKGFFLFN